MRAEKLLLDDRLHKGKLSQSSYELAAIKLQAKFDMYAKLCRYRPEYPGLKPPSFCADLAAETYSFQIKYPGVTAPVFNP